MLVQLDLVGVPLPLFELAVDVAVVSFGVDLLEEAVDAVLESFAFLFKSFLLKILFRVIMALALCDAVPKGDEEDCDGCCCCCCCRRFVLTSTAECRLVRGKKSEFSRRKPRIKFCGNFESDSCLLWVAFVLALLKAFEAVDGVADEEDDDEDVDVEDLLLLLLILLLLLLDPLVAFV